MILKEWRRSYPRSDESIKSISVKFAKYDRNPELNSSSRADRDGVIWEDPLIKDLLQTRINAEHKVRMQQLCLSLHQPLKT